MVRLLSTSLRQRIRNFLKRQSRPPPRREGEGGQTGGTDTLEGRCSGGQTSTEVAAAWALLAARVTRGMGVNTRQDTTSNDIEPGQRLSFPTASPTTTAATPGRIGTRPSSVNRSRGSNSKKRTIRDQNCTYYKAVSYTRGVAARDVTTTRL